MVKKSKKSNVNGTENESPTMHGHSQSQKINLSMVFPLTVCPGCINGYINWGVINKVSGPSGSFHISKEEGSSWCLSWLIFLCQESLVPIPRLGSPLAVLLPGDTAWAWGSAVGSPLLLLLPRLWRNPGSREYSCKQVLGASAWSCQWKLRLPLEPCGTRILEAVWPETELFASRLSENSTYFSAFVQAAK